MTTLHSPPATPQALAGSAEWLGVEAVQLEALALARQRSTVLSARSTRWFVLAGVAFVGLWSWAGFQVAMMSLLAAGVLFLVLATKGVIPPVHTAEVREVSAVADTIERDILQRVAEGVAPWLRVRRRSPLEASHVRASRLPRLRIVDAISEQRCLSGLYPGDIPFCAAAITGTEMVVIRRPQMLPVTRPETVFRGLFVLADHPGTEGWVTLEATSGRGAASLLDAVLGGDEGETIAFGDAELEALFTVRGSSLADARRAITRELSADLVAFRRAHPDVLPSIAIHDDAIAVAIPTREAPFSLRDNRATWPAELQQFAETARLLVDLLGALHPARPARMMEAAR